MLDGHLQLVFLLPVLKIPGSIPGPEDGCPEGIFRVPHFRQAYSRITPSNMPLRLYFTFFSIHHSQSHSTFYNTILKVLNKIRNMPLQTERTLERLTIDLWSQKTGANIISHEGANFCPRFLVLTEKYCADHEIYGTAHHTSTGETRYIRWSA
jgi:hypothetical protein